MVVQARDSHCAAIWVAHQTLSRSLPFLCDEAEDYLQLADVSRLSGTIRVSQRGFDRRDAEVHETLDIVAEWNQLLVALDRLQSRLAAAQDNATCEPQHDSFAAG